MLDAGSGGGYSGTYWSGMSMVDIWMTFQNQDTTPHWEMLTGWRRSYELTLQHMSAVKRYRDNLAAAWPPQKSMAAQAYVSQLDGLINHLQRTYDAAAANYSAFSGATSALKAARREVEPVVNEYLSNAGKIADYERELASPPPVGEDGIAPPVRNPVTAGRQAELEAKARGVMSGLSVELVSARTQLQQPPAYKPATIGEHESDGPGGSYVAPPIPAVVPFDPGAGGDASSIGNSPNASAPHGSVGSNTSGSTNNPGRLPGLVLGGTQPPVAPLLPSPINPPSIVGNSSPTPVGPIAPIGPGRPTQTRPGASRSTASPAAGARGLPSGGVIGARPGIGMRQPGGRLPTTVNPVGGVITPNAPNRTGAAGGRPGAAVGGRQIAQPIAPLGSQPVGGDDESAPTQDWDPENPWATAKGVDPVLMPPEEQRVDPGPAIGLT